MTRHGFSLVSDYNPDPDFTNFRGIRPDEHRRTGTPPEVREAG